MLGTNARVLIVIRPFAGGRLQRRATATRWTWPGSPPSLYCGRRAGAST